MNPAIISACQRDIEALLAAYPELGEDDQLRADMIEGETSLSYVAGKLIAAMKERAVMIEGRKALIKEYAAKNEASDKAVLAMREALSRLLQASGLTAFRCPAGTASLSQRKGWLKFSDDFDASKLRPGLSETVVTHKPNREAILAALEAGEEVEGAYIANGSTILTVR